MRQTCKKKPFTTVIYSLKKFRKKALRKEENSPFR